MTLVSAGTTSSGADRSARLGACLERARNGDRSALPEAIRELNPLLWHVARTQGLGRDDAADVVQTAWLQLLRGLDGIRSPQALTSWLVTTVRREAWRIRSRSRRTATDDEMIGDMPDPDPEPVDVLLADERDRVLWRHFQQLSQRCRRLLRMVAEVDRPDYSVIAEAMGMPRGSVGPTRGRCLAKLRQLLMDDPAWNVP
jgi:RNA polymerase sigma factor (sigma-70 family)